MYMSSLDRLREKMQANNLDVFLVTQEHNRRYLSGFTGTAGVLLVTPDKQFLITDYRYYERVKHEAPDWTLIQAGPKTMEAINSVLMEHDLKGKQIGFEADHVTVAQLQSWRETLGEIPLVETTDFIISLRAAKTERELASIRKAVTIADQAMFHVYNWIQPGMTEKEVAWELEVFMRTHGADRLSFEPIVAAGANGASPHAAPSDYKIQFGDPVIVDIGCVVDGYCSDVTRTFSLGEPNQAQYRAVWEIVYRANAVATGGIKAGMSSKEADALARDLIKAANYGDNFGHGLGHGVGLTIHESPHLSYTKEIPLPEGAVVTIEPGIYLPEAFGVRIEDMAVITKDEVEVLTGVPKVSVLER